MTPGRERPRRSGRSTPATRSSFPTRGTSTPQWARRPRLQGAGVDQRRLRRAARARGRRGDAGRDRRARQRAGRRDRLAGGDGPRERLRRPSPRRRRSRSRASARRARSAARSRTGTPTTRSSTAWSTRSPGSRLRSRRRARFDFPFTFTARAENQLRGLNDLDDTIARLQAYEEAGADVLYAPGLRSLRRDPHCLRRGLEACERARVAEPDGRGHLRSRRAAHQLRLVALGRLEAPRLRAGDGSRRRDPRHGRPFAPDLSGVSVSVL